MKRSPDRHHIAYFISNSERIGAVSYCTFKSEDGKCFIFDFWIFEGKREKGLGLECFYALAEYTERDGAEYYEINCDGRADKMGFWKSLGFIENGTDEYGVVLLVRR